MTNNAVREINERAVWDAFLASVRPHTFLHTWEWGVFQERLGHRILRIGLFEDTSLVAIALFITIQSKKGSFVLCPHGPLFMNGRFEEYASRLPAIISFTKEHARKECCAYLRIAPLLQKDQKIESIFTHAGFHDAPIHVHPERAWILDIRPPEEKLLEAMRKTTRYSIRKAVKDGVRIRSTRDPKEVRSFYDLYLTTVGRQHFTPFSFSYVLNELACFQGGSDSDAQIFFAEYQGETLATALAVFTPWSGFYHHGAASLIYPKIPASYLLQWEIIREAKKRGCEYYNFWGLSHKNPTTFFDQMARIFRPIHPWAGITLFKTGFGGFEQNYIHAQDLILQHPPYWMTYAIESARRIKRGL